jgi:ATP-dependent RNA helicase DeaD
MINTFEKLGINENLVMGLSKANITIPTPIQFEAIPFALENKDIIGQAQTGSGKTLAYLVPIFQKIDTTKRENQTIILAPTHELVMQIDKEIKLLSINSNINVTSTTIIGEVNISRQIEKLKEKPHIIVGSLGRIYELIKLKKISAHTVKTIVIDEGDILLDMNNLMGVKDIIKTTLKDRQLLVYSATINDKTMLTAKELMKDAVIIKVEENCTVNTDITHIYLLSEQRDKVEILRKLIASITPERALIFLNKSEEIKRVTAKLKYHHQPVYGIYGKAPKEERQKALEGFRNGKFKLLVASDLAARGLDITDVTHIFNLDLPEDSKEYLHRVGRTSRAGKAGTAISIVTEREETFLKAFSKEFKIDIIQKEIYQGKLIEPGTGKRV